MYWYTTVLWLTLVDPTMSCRLRSPTYFKGIFDLVTAERFDISFNPTGFPLEMTMSENQIPPGMKLNIEKLSIFKIIKIRYKAVQA